MGNSSAEAALEEGDWQRLSPIGIAFFINKFIFKFIREGLQSALPAVAIFITSVEHKLFWASLVLPIILCFIVLIAAVYWWHYKFCVLGHEILLDQGFLSKKRLNLDFSRVQNVNISTPFYFSPFKLVNCIFDSAGSTQSEVSLPGVSEDFAIELRELIFNYKQSVKATDEQEEVASIENLERKEPLVRLSNRESAKYGLTNMIALFFIAALLPFMQQIGSFIQANILPSVSHLVQKVIVNPFIADALAFGLIIILMFAAIMGFSILAALLRFYNFELYDEGDKLTRFMGLFERHQMSMSKHKVQSVEIKQNVMAKLLKRVSVSFKQANTAINNPLVKNKDLLIPMLKPEQWQSITKQVFDTKVGREGFEPIHSSYLRRVFIYFQLLPFGLIFGGLAFINIEFLWGLLILIPLLLILYGKYRAYGLYADHEYCALRQGLIGRKITIFPLFKIQQVSYRQSRGQRRLGVGSLRIVIASGTLTLPYVPMKTIYQLYDQALYSAESDKRDWL